MHNKKEVSRQIYRMLIPMILENVLTTSASLVTTAMVGRLTALEISAQGVGGRITNTYLSLFKGLAIGVTVVAALYFGEGRRDKCRRTVEQAFATAVPLGLMITGLVAVFPRWFIRLFTSDADIMSYAVGYLQILTVGLPRIKSLRKKSGLTQEQLAEKINVTSTYIVKIENSQRTGSIEFSVELAKCFGVSLDYLLLGEEVGNKKQVLQRVISFLSELEAEL